MWNSCSLGNTVLCIVNTPPYVISLYLCIMYIIVRNCMYICMCGITSFVMPTVCHQYNKYPKHY